MHPTEKKSAVTLGGVRLTNVIWIENNLWRFGPAVLSLSLDPNTQFFMAVKTAAVNHIV